MKCECGEVPTFQDSLLSLQAKASKFGLSDTEAQKEINGYFVQQQKLATETVNKPREVDCIGKVRP